MKQIAVFENDDDYRQATVWRSNKASVYVVVYCDEKSANWKDETFSWNHNNCTSKSKNNMSAYALMKALDFASKKVLVDNPRIKP